MAVNSDIVDTFVNKNRIRTMNYRGSLINTTCIVSSAVTANTDAYLMLIPYGASIKNIKICVSSDIEANTIFSFYMHGINADRSFTVITAPENDATAHVILSHTLTATNANTIIDINAAPLWGQTIYQKLCYNETNSTQLLAAQEGFKEYKDTAIGILSIRSSAALTVNNGWTLTCSINWVDPSPSETPLIHKVFSTSTNNANEALGMVGRDPRQVYMERYLPQLMNPQQTIDYLEEVVTRLENELTNPSSVQDLTEYINNTRMQLNYAYGVINTNEAMELMNRAQNLLNVLQSESEGEVI